MANRTEYNNSVVNRYANFQIAGRTAFLGASGSSANVQLPTLNPNIAATDLLITNDGANTAFIALGNDSLTSAIAPTLGNPQFGMPVKPGAQVIINKMDYTWVAAVTSTSTTTLYFTQGMGS